MSTELTPPKSRLKKSWLAAIAALIVIAAITALLPYFRSPATSLPSTLGDLRLTKTILGDEAKAIINQMHGKGVTPTDNLIGTYQGTGGTATLYLSNYETREQSQQVLAKMVGGIKTGFTPFSNYERMIIENTEVSFSIGSGQSHYFFCSGKSLYWLTADPAVAVSTLRSLLDTLKGTATNA